MRRPVITVAGRLDLAVGCHLVCSVGSPPAAWLYPVCRPRYIEAIVEVLIRLRQLAADQPEICELDINPLLADAAGVVALYARLRIAPTKSPRSARLAIAPDPKELETAARLRDGTVLGLRPLRPEDEPLLHDLAAI
jgi:acetyltransferase